MEEGQDFSLHGKAVVNDANLSKSDRLIKPHFSLQTA